MLNCVLSLSPAVQNFQWGQTHKSLPLNSCFCAVVTCGVNPHKNLLMWIFSQSFYISPSLTVPTCWQKIKCTELSHWLAIIGIMNWNYSLSCQKAYYTYFIGEIIWIGLPNVECLFRSISLIWRFVLKYQKIYLYQGSIYKHSFCKDSYGSFPSDYWMFPDKKTFFPPQWRDIAKTLWTVQIKTCQEIYDVHEGSCMKRKRKNRLSKTGNNIFLRHNTSREINLLLFSDPFGPSGG